MACLIGGNCSSGTKPQQRPRRVDRHLRLRHVLLPFTRQPEFAARPD